MHALALGLPVAFAALLGGMSAVERWLNHCVDQTTAPDRSELPATSRASASAPGLRGTDLPPARSAASRAWRPSSSCIASTTGHGPSPLTGVGEVSTDPSAK